MGFPVAVNIETSNSDEDCSHNTSNDDPSDGSSTEPLLRGGGRQALWRDHNLFGRQLLDTVRCGLVLSQLEENRHAQHHFILHTSEYPNTNALITSAPVGAFQVLQIPGFLPQSRASECWEGPQAASRNSCSEHMINLGRYTEG